MIYWYNELKNPQWLKDSKLWESKNINKLLNATVEELDGLHAILEVAEIEKGNGLSNCSKCFKCDLAG